MMFVIVLCWLCRSMLFNVLVWWCCSQFWHASVGTQQSELCCGFFSYREFEGKTEHFIVVFMVSKKKEWTSIYTINFIMISQCLKSNGEVTPLLVVEDDDDCDGWSDVIVDVPRLIIITPMGDGDGDDDDDASLGGPISLWTRSQCSSLILWHESYQSFNICVSSSSSMSNLLLDVDVLVVNSWPLMLLLLLLVLLLVLLWSIIMTSLVADDVDADDIITGVFDVNCNKCSLIVVVVVGADVAFLLMTLAKAALMVLWIIFVWILCIVFLYRYCMGMVCVLNYCYKFNDRWIVVLCYMMYRTGWLELL